MVTMGKRAERLYDVSDGLGRYVSEMNMQQRWDRKGLRGLRSLAFLCGGNNRSAFILVYSVDSVDYEASYGPSIFSI